MTDLTVDQATPQARIASGLIDCDVHNAVPSDDALKPYLSTRWRDHMDHIGARTYAPYETGFLYPKVSPGGGSRTDAWPPGGGLPGSDLGFMTRQLLEPLGTSVVVLNTLYRAAEQRNDAYGAVLARAVNDWQIEHWLDRDSRMRASVTVAFEDPVSAADEIRRCAEHPGFVQVLLLPRTREPLGRPRYRPLFEAAQETGLPIGIHFASTTAAAVTPAGWPSYYIEDHTAMSLAFQAQMSSLIVSGVLDRFSELKVAFIEGGFAWIPNLLARLDGLCHRLEPEVQDLQRLPSDYLGDRIKVTTQPMEEPEDPSHLVHLIEELGTQVLMFSTDYPHWDFDHPERAFQTRLPAELLEKILRGNALDFYELEKTA